MTGKMFEDRDYCLEIEFLQIVVEVAKTFFVVFVLHKSAILAIFLPFYQIRFWIGLHKKQIHFTF